MVAAVAKSDSCDESDSARRLRLSSKRRRGRIAGLVPPNHRPIIVYWRDVHLEASGMAAHENVGLLVY
jgi:hypothetical protein